MMDVVTLHITKDHPSQITGFTRHGSKTRRHEIYTAQIHPYKENYLQYTFVPIHAWYSWYPINACIPVSLCVCVCVYGLLVLIILRNKALLSQFIGTVVTLVEMQQGFYFSSGSSCGILRCIYNPVSCHLLFHFLILHHAPHHPLPIPLSFFLRCPFSCSSGLPPSLFLSSLR